MRANHCCGDSPVRGHAAWWSPWGVDSAATVPLCATSVGSDRQGQPQPPPQASLGTALSCVRPRLRTQHGLARGWQGRQQLGLAEVGRASARAVVLPALAPLTRFRQIALCRAQAIVQVVPGRAALPSGTVERASSLCSGSQAGGSSSWTGTELGEAALSGIGATSSQDGQGVDPGGPVCCGAFGALQPQTSHTRRQQREPACRSDVRVGVVSFARSASRHCQMASSWPRA